MISVFTGTLLRNQPSGTNEYTLRCDIKNYFLQFMKNLSYFFSVKYHTQTW